MRCDNKGRAAAAAVDRSEMEEVEMDDLGSRPPASAKAMEIPMTPTPPNGHKAVAFARKANSRGVVQIKFFFFFLVFLVFFLQISCI
jgi:hypothetical protein